MSDIDSATATIQNVLQGAEKTKGALEPVMEALKEIKEDKDKLVEVSKVIWIASRNEDWRTPLGEAGVLDFFQSLLPELKGNDEELQLNALKILGNGCIDKDENRRRFIEHPVSLAPFIAALSSPETSTIGSIVLHNIVTDYEPAQTAAVDQGAVLIIFNVLESQSLDGPINHFLRILELLLSHGSGKNATPDSAPDILLRILLTPDDEGEPVDFDNALSIIALLSALLGVSRMQSAILKSVANDDRSGFPTLITALEWSFDNIKPDTSTEEREKKDLGLIRHARNQLIECMGEVATAPEFLKTYSLDSSVMQRVKELLKVQGGKEELTIGACMIIGNIGRSDEVCTALVKDSAIQVPILAVIEDTISAYDTAVKAIRSKSSTASSSSDTGSTSNIDPAKALEAVRVTSTGAMSISILHAAVGVLKNLAIPQVNKTALVDAGAFAAIRRMLLLSGVATGQIYYAAISLARLLIVENMRNIDVMLAVPETAEQGSEKSTFSLLLSRYEADAEAPIKTEIARLVVATLRCSFRDSTGSMRTVNKLMKYEEIGSVVWGMVTQDAYPSVRSEGWFAMALLVGTDEGRRWVEKGTKEVWPVIGAGGKEQTTEKEEKKTDLPVGRVLGEAEEKDTENEQEETKEEVKNERTGEEVMRETIRRGGREVDNVAVVAAECGMMDVLREALNARGD